MAVSTFGFIYAYAHSREGENKKKKSARSSREPERLPRGVCATCNPQRSPRAVAALSLFALSSAWSTPSFAAFVADLREGATEMSQRIQALHHLSLTVCVVVGVIVFGAMFYSIFAHRRSKRREPAHFHENTRLEVVWTLIPTMILVGMAVPATTTLMEIEDNSDADLTVLITASQWKWHYQYVEAGFGYYSNLATPRRQIDNLEAKGEHYLLEADRPLVLPTNKKVRFLTTSRDVIHSWWVPDFAVKQDAIPGFINEAWTRVGKPGRVSGSVRGAVRQGSRLHAHRRGSPA